MKMVEPRRRSRASGARARLVPERHDVRLGATRRRDLVAEAGKVTSGRLGRDATLRCPIEETEPEQIRLVHVLDRLDLFGQHGREGCYPHRTRGELLDDRGEELAIGRVEPCVVDL